MSRTGASPFTIAARASLTGSKGIQEDRISVQGNRAWAIDGATALLEELGLPGESDAAWYASKLDACLTATASTTSVKDGLRQAIEDIDCQAKTLAGEELVRFPSAAVLIIEATQSGTEVLSLADCHLLVETVNLDVVHVGPTSGDDYLLDKEAVINRRRHRNTPDGIWVARRESIAVEHAVHLRLPPSRRVLLATDGAWRAHTLQFAPTYREMLDAFSSPESAESLLQQIREADAQRYGYWDDATVAVLES